MASKATTMRVLHLYKAMLRESANFTGYNYRLYAQRRIKDAFREHKCETDVNRINSLVQHAEDNLQLIKRQVTISQLYKEPKLVIE
ncbi:LYR motif-containing protein 4-like [Apostichopus japonicus]|uniref:LYR motif-containing protein 4-like n=1 Tax=Stichopus japonicus TaxID=307972 RepID=UPI003AB77272